MHQKPVMIVLIVVYIFIAFFQIWSTNINYAYSFSAVEVDKTTRSVNIYPASLGRFGRIIETKKEVLIIRKFISNFFNVVDPGEYFPSRLPLISAPLVVIGIYFIFSERKKRKNVFFLFLLTILILSVLGPYQKYGPVLIYPFFLIATILTLQKIFKQNWI